MPGIVVGVDGSPNSVHALDWAMKEAVARHMPLTVLAVHQVMRGHWSETPVPVHGDIAELEKTRKEAEALAHRVADRLGDARPVSITVHAVNGLPASELVDASKDADLVVVGSRGSGGFARLLIGSVSNQVVHHAFCPVVVVPHEA